MKQNIYASIGAAIRARRDAVGLTQAQVAEKAGLSRTTLTNIERGGQALLVHQLLDLARVLRVSPGSLLPSTTLAAIAQEGEPVPDTIKALLDRLKEPSAQRRRR
ncbi:helix-turn-helix domain-containing protein [Bradyrhizobium diversitatis]|uniref:Helix-turn-helix transcriptional regulator n=1 Tax=Bradyrhizobium diversitatis TaxID=2755406 RepID=A0ABS0PF00_9BRAD|nr:helix-turn-helix transcriptional regulator [Bradyrhizobium diversitatis]